MSTVARNPNGSDRGPDGHRRKASRYRPARALVILAVAAAMLVPVIGAEAAPQKLAFTAAPQAHVPKNEPARRGPRPRPTPKATPAPTTAPSPTATAATPAPAGTATPTSSPTATPTVAPTATPGATVAPTATPTSTPTPVVNPPVAVTPFVTSCGTSLCLFSAPYRFTGLSIYNANSRNNCWYSLGFGDSALSTTLDQIGTGMEAFRAWFYQGLAGTPSARDWSAFDHTLAVAKAHGVRVIVSLSGEGGDCKDYPVDVRKTESWYATGYQAREASGESYLGWVREVVTRYRDDPTILAWQMMGEAEDPADASGTCTSTANATLKSWADVTSATIKSIDTNHLVTVGVIGSGQCGASGTAYQDLHSSPNIDMCTREDYDDPTSVIPGDRWNGMQVRIDECHALGKPVFVSESGLHRSVTNRAAALNAKWSAQFSAGMVGELLWDWSSGPISDNYEITPGDAVLPLLAQY